MGRALAKWLGACCTATLLLLSPTATRGDDELRHWREAGNAATFLGLSDNLPLTLPTSLSVVFIGFSGEGEARLNLSEAELAPWFHALNHQLHLPPPHALADEAVPAAAVKYATRLNVHRLGPAVTERIEDLLSGHLRPERTATTPFARAGGAAAAPLQMNARTMSAVLSSLQTAIGLGGFTLFVLNPRRPPTAAAGRYGYRAGHGYGYRAGHSADELEILRGWRSTEAKRLLQGAAHLVHDDGTAPMLVEQPGAAAVPATARGGEHSVSARANRWAAGAGLELLSKGFPAEEASIEQRGTEAALRSRVAATLGGAEAGLSKAAARLVEAWRLAELRGLDEAVRGARPVDDASGGGGGGGDPAASCLSDLWLSSGTHAFVDLSASPCWWGPPDSAADAADATSDTGGSVSAGGHLAEPQPVPSAAHAAEPALPSAANLRALEAERAELLELARHACARAEASGAIPAPTRRPRRRTGGAAADADADGDFTIHEVGDGAEAEASAEADGLDGSSAEADQTECDELKERLLEFEAYLEDYRREELVGGGVAAGPAEGHSEANSTAAPDLEAHLARVAALARLLHERVLLPPTAGLERSTYAERVAFHFYVVASHRSFSADGPDGLGLGVLQRGLESLRLPGQAFSFTSHHLGMAEDPRLAMAYATSVRHAVIPGLGGRRGASSAAEQSAGQLPGTEVTYVDSRALAAALRRAAPPPTPASGPSASRVVPIFFFSTDSPLPLLIDRTHLAKVVDEMVLVVQSAHPAHPRPMLCGPPRDGLSWLFAAAAGQGATTQLRANLQRPHRAALAAAAELLGGLLPHHLGYSAAPAPPDGVAPEWQWAVGDSPFAATSSSSTAFAAHHAHLLHRNYVVAALNSSASDVAEAAAQLSGTPTTDADALDVLRGAAAGSALRGAGWGARASADAAPQLRLRTMHAKLRSLQQRALGHAARFEAAEAAELLAPLRRTSRDLLRLSTELAQQLRRRRCAAGAAGAAKWSWPGAAVASAAVVAGLVGAAAWAARSRLSRARHGGKQVPKQLAVLGPRYFRPKVNID